jgi:hypothetical protein
MREFASRAGRDDDPEELDLSCPGQPYSVRWVVGRPYRHVSTSCPNVSTCAMRGTSGSGPAVDEPGEVERERVAAEVDTGVPSVDSRRGFGRRPCPAGRRILAALGGCAGCQPEAQAGESELAWALLSDRVRVLACV